MHKRRQVPKIAAEQKNYLRRGFFGWQFKRAGILFFKDFAILKRIIRRLITKKRPKMKKRDKKKMKYLKKKKKKKRRFSIDSMTGLFKRLILKRLRKLKKKLRKRFRRRQRKHPRVWFYLFPNYLTSQVFTGKRMGRGKGTPNSWGVIFKNNLIFLEFYGVHPRALVSALRRFRRMTMLPIVLIKKTLKIKAYVRRQPSYTTLVDTPVK